MVDLLHSRCMLGINHILLIFVDSVPEGMCTAGALGLLCTHTHASADVLGKLLGIVGSHAFNDSFQNDAFRSIRDGFGYIVDFDTVFFRWYLLRAISSWFRPIRSVFQIIKASNACFAASASIS